MERHSWQEVAEQEHKDCMEWCEREVAKERAFWKKQLAMETAFWKDQINELRNHYGRRPWYEWLMAVTLINGVVYYLFR